MIKFVTPDGNVPIKVPQYLTLEELLLINRLPPTAITALQKKLGEYIPIPVHDEQKIINENINEVIYLRPDRNIDYSSANPQRVNIDVTTVGAAEYPVRISNNLIENQVFTQEDCRCFVRTAVANFFSNLTSFQKNAPIVLGYSGGGDSNALLDALLNCSKIDKRQILPVMMLGVPDWDAMHDTAVQETAKRGLNLITIPASRVSAIMGMPDSKDWLKEFQHAFPGEDIEFIGTYALRKTLGSVMHEHKAQAVITGLNSEDLFAECLAAMSQGLPSPPLPRRKIENVEFWFPLYLVPKKIGDGCAPKLSRKNYDARKPSFAYGRALYYYAAQTLQYFCPGLVQDLLRGIELRHATALAYEYPAEFEISGKETLVKWNSLFKNND